MKKFLVALLSVMMFAGVASADYLYEEYAGHQDVYGGSYKFNFDLWYVNNFSPNTNSALSLTKDAVSAPGMVYTAGKVFVDFNSIDDYDEAAKVKFSAYGSNAGVQTLLFEENVAFDLDGGIYSWSYNLSAAQLNILDAWGWGNVVIGLGYDGPWYDFDNDFAIKKVALGVTAVPEPATMLLLGLGLVGLGAYGRKRV